MAKGTVWSGPFLSGDEARSEAKESKKLYEREGGKFVARKVDSEAWYVYRTDGKWGKNSK